MVEHLQHSTRLFVVMALGAFFLATLGCAGTRPSNSSEELGLGREFLIRFPTDHRANEKASEFGHQPWRADPLQSAKHELQVLFRDFGPAFDESGESKFRLLNREKRGKQEIAVVEKHHPARIGHFNGGVILVHMRLSPSGVWVANEIVLRETTSGRTTASTACPSSADRSPPAHSQGALRAEVDALEKAEARWRLPNSHASLGSSEERDLRQDMLRGYVLLQTARVGTAMQPEDVLYLKTHLASLRPSDEYRVFVVARLLATAGVPFDSIVDSLNRDAKESRVLQEFLPKIVREGQFLHQHGMAFARFPTDAQTRRDLGASGEVEQAERHHEEMAATVRQIDEALAQLEGSFDSAQKKRRDELTKRKIDLLLQLLEGELAEFDG